jgi:hypothetical protein
MQEYTSEYSASTLQEYASDYRVHYIISLQNIEYTKVEYTTVYLTWSTYPSLAFHGARVPFGICFI